MLTYLLALDERNHVTQVVEAALDVITSFAFESVVVRAFLRLILTILRHRRSHLHVVHTDGILIQLIKVEV